MKRVVQRSDGWILLEVVAGLIAASLLTAALSEVWIAGIRGAGAASTHLTEERHRTLAVHYALKEARSATPVGTIATRLKERFPNLTISVSDEVLSISGEELHLEVAP